MAETVRPVCERRAHTEADGGKPALPLRGRGCGRKRKGTPVKVFVSDSGEGPGQGKGVAERASTADKNKSLPQKLNKVSNGSKGSSCSTPAPLPPTTTGSAQTSPHPSLPSASAPRHSSPPAPNCRIREVHCANQVRLVVIAIRDITRGEEITVDYSLIEWGENLGFSRGLSPAQHEYTETENNNKIKKEEEPFPLIALHQEQQQVYVTPSWSLSPSASPISHSDGSGSEREEDNPSLRGHAPPLQKKQQSTPSKKNPPYRTSPGRAQQTAVGYDHLDQSIPSSDAPPHQLPTSPSSSFSPKPVFKAPGPFSAIDCITQTCEFCGRNFRSLGRHLDKHHAHQPDVCSALVELYTQMPRLQAQSPHPNAAQSHLPPLVKSLEESEVHELSLSPPNLMAAHHSPSVSPPPSQSAVGVCVHNRSPPPAVVGPIRKGGKKRSKTGMRNQEEDLGESGLKRVNDENVCALSPLSGAMESVKVKQDDTSDIDEENGMREVEFDSGADDKEKMLSPSGHPRMLYLLSSLSSLVLYLRRLQHSAFLSLSRQLQSAEAWRLLCHSSLSLLILYNRRRECEVSKLLITEYHSRVTPQCPIPVPPGAPPALTPLEATLSPFERLVLTHLPRVGVQGKRGRVQPLILPPHSEPCLELLLQTRHGVGVDPANPYMFARPYHSPATPLRGTELLRSLARSSGIHNPRTLTQTRVRRQVGILTQLLLLGEGEEPGQVGGGAVERLEQFLEREYHVMQSCADIGQDAGLMGRVGRVVLCGERDGVLFRGMSLNHICLELDVMSENSADSYSEGESDGETVKEKSEASGAGPLQTQASALLNVKKTKNKGRTKKPKNTQALHSLSTLLVPLLPANRRGLGKRGVLKRPWSEAERAAVEEHLNQNITELRVPAKADCERCLQNSPLLVNNHRDWRAVKFYCHNRIQLLKKIQRRESQPLLCAEEQPIDK
ncbi:uncharacterized protein si:dkey-117m1.4 [Periophthalmus magnuspinnatus]|uniref:uncharacterized protein si:dkey-117m1.4 n=1 Tax=Periophthalmus magnuspinnatus TaxID=409849 RepID=UPI002436DEF9|nr:uncharacterized protein si:dkey-117m1.4 [Periophthalmus magnuspinnatus]